jgi:acid phosphatase (class A)
MKITKTLFAVVIVLLALPTLAAQEPLYLAHGEVDLTFYLPPPPANGSIEERAEIGAMLTIQSTRTDAQRLRSTQDAEFSVFRFADVLGANFDRTHLPITAAFFDKIFASTWSLIGHGKDTWHRPRPFETISALHPEDSVRNGVINPQTGSIGPSYPSGHAFLGMVAAILLSDAVPEKRAALFARGDEYGKNRVVALVHYPSDVQAGQRAAAIAVFALMTHPEFVRDFENAKAELRSVLH